MKRKPDKIKLLKEVVNSVSNHSLIKRDGYQTHFYKYFQTAKEAKEDSINVINYYGIGGIGKTKLCELLSKSICKDDIMFVKYDFENAIDVKDVLIHMKNAICKEYGKFYFPIFECACLILESKLNAQEIAFQVKKKNSLFEKYPSIANLLDLIGQLPKIGIIATMLKYTSQAEDVARSVLCVDENRHILDNLETLTPTQILEKLPYLFALDMNENLSKIKRKNLKFIFFFDTYELEVDEHSKIGIPLTNDLWLRGAEGLIRNIPNVMWVISGREKLKWKDLDIYWEQHPIHQYEVDAFTEDEARQYLNLNGIVDTGLIDNILFYTKQRMKEYEGDVYKEDADGKDRYLPLILNIYIECVRDNILLDNPQQMNMTYVLNRLVKYFDDTQRSMLDYMVCMRTGNIEEFEEVLELVKCEFNDITYGKLVNNVLIEQYEDRFQIKKIVWPILVAGCSDYKIKKYLNALLAQKPSKIQRYDMVFELFERIRNMDESLFHNVIEMMFETLDELLISYRCNDFERLFSKLSKSLQQINVEKTKTKLQLYEVKYYLMKVQYSDAFAKASELLSDVCDYNEDNKIIIEIYCQAAYCMGKYNDVIAYSQLLLNKSTCDEERITQHIRIIGARDEAGRYNEVLEHCDEVLKKYSLTDMDRIKIMRHQINALHKTKRSPEALDISKQQIDICEKLYGKDSFDYYEAIDGLATLYLATDNIRKAKEMFQENYITYVNCLGEDHPIVLKAYCNLAHCKYYDKDFQSASAMYKEVYEKSRSILGEDHVTTLEFKNYFERVQNV